AVRRYSADRVLRQWRDLARPPLRPHRGADPVHVDGTDQRETSGAMLRLFVGIEFPSGLKLQLSMLDTGIPGAKWVDAGNLYLTLRFIGEVDEGIAVDIDEALVRV